MFRRKSYTCCVLAAVLFAAESVLASPPWIVRTWQSDEGLPDNTVLGIEQTPDGFLWAITQTGLVRFDGVQFREFPVQLSDKELGATFALCADQRGRLWVAKEQGSVVCVEQGRPMVIIAPDKNQPDRRVRMLVEDGEGAVWASFISGDLARIKEGSVRFFTEADGLPAGGIAELTIDRDGHLWFLQSHRVFVFRNNRLCPRVETPAERLCASRAGGVWLCDGRQIYKYTEASGLSEKRDLQPEGGVVEPTVLYEDRAGRLWIGTRLTGLFCYDGTSISKVDITQQTIFSLKEDLEGNIWVGTRGGGLKQLKHRIASLLTAGSAAPFEGIQSICKDTEGQLWAVIWQKGTVVRNAGQDWALLTPRDGWDGEDAKCVAADPQGGVWIGTSSKGVYRWQDGAVTHHFCSTNGLAYNFVNSIRTTESGGLWMGSWSPTEKKHLLLYWKEGKFREFVLPVDSGFVTAIEVDASGDCWASTSRGVLVRVRGAVLTDETRNLLPQRYPLRSLLATPDRSLWIGFAGMGLGRLKDGQFTHFGREQGLHDDYISQILSDGRGRLWFAGNRGIFSVREKDFNELAEGRVLQVHSVVYRQKDGLPGLQASYDAWPCALRDADGRLLFAMQSGVAILHTEEIQEDSKPPSVVIDRVLANGKTIARYGAGKSLTDTHGSVPLELGLAGVHLRFSPGQRQIEFAFTTPGFTSPENMSFKYRLHGLDKDWVDSGTRRTVLYSQLLPGDYRFQVTACNRSGVWNETGSAVELTVEPYWWETVWCRVGGPLAAVGVLLGLIFLGVRRRQQHQLERLEQQQSIERERVRIAADLHDGMGSDLAQIGLLCERAREELHEPSRAKGYLDKALANAHALAGELDAVVWSVDPANDTLEQFVLYFSNFVQDLLALTHIRLRLVVPEELPAIMLSSMSRHQLFLAAKEALHNVVQHAGATQVTVRISLDPQSLLVEIEDDGCGLPVVRPLTAGADGLANMARRMEKVNGRCEFLSGPDGRGTRVRLLLPVS